MRDPKKIHDLFRTLTEEAAREIVELRQAREKTINEQVDTLRSVEAEWNWARRDRSLAAAASTYSRFALSRSAKLKERVEKIAEAEVGARDQLVERFGDQRRFEAFLSQRQIKERALARKREEKNLLEQIEQIRQAKARKG